MDKNILDEKEPGEIIDTVKQIYLVYVSLTTGVKQDGYWLTDEQATTLDSFWVGKEKAINRAKEIMNDQMGGKWDFLDEDHGMFSWSNDKKPMNNHITVVPLTLMVWGYI